MLFGRGSSELPIPGDVRDWRPQTAGTGKFRSVVDPIIEPFWDGIPVLVHLEPDSVRMIDESGNDNADVFPDLVAALAESAREAGTERLIAHAVLTGQTIDEQLTGQLFVEPPTGGQIARHMLVGGIGENRPPMPPALDPDKPVSLVMVDLLEIDGESLLNVPLLERKRLLEGAVRRQRGVKITPFAQPPGDNFRMSCRAHGFWAVIYKAANSRYEPGRESRDWAVLRLPTR